MEYIIESYLLVFDSLFWLVFLLILFINNSNIIPFFKL